MEKVKKDNKLKSGRCNLRSSSRIIWAMGLNLRLRLQKLELERFRHLSYASSSLYLSSLYPSSREPHRAEPMPDTTPDRMVRIVSADFSWGRTEFGLARISQG